MDSKKWQTCTAYYIFTVLYMLFMPIAVIIQIDKTEVKILRSTTTFSLSLSYIIEYSPYLSHLRCFSMHICVLENSN